MNSSSYNQCVCSGLRVFIQFVTTYIILFLIQIPRTNRLTFLLDLDGDCKRNVEKKKQTFLVVSTRIRVHTTSYKICTVIHII